MKKNEAAAALLPADVRASGTPTIASSAGAPPAATYLPDGRTVAGADIDIADAAARALGLELKRETAAFNGLKADGTYDRILKKWGIGASAIETSRISPPGIK